MKLHKYQINAADFVMSKDRCNLFVPMGMGKTRTVITALDALNLTEDAFPALVVAPLRVARATWPDEVKKWMPHLRVSIICGSPSQRLKALRAKADIYCINYENAEWLAEQLTDGSPFKTIVADEASKLRSYRGRGGGKRAAALAKIAHFAKRYIGLTGTPAPNGLLDLWALGWFVDGGVALGRTFSAFQNRWFTPIRVGSEPHAVKWVPTATAQKEIEERMAPTTFTLRVKDWFDINDPIVVTRRVQLPQAARDAYDAMEKELFAEIGGEEIEAVNVAVRTSKLIQICSGAVYGEQKGTWSHVHDEKLEALDEIIEEQCGAPTLVCYHFQSDLARILKRFPQARQLDHDPQTIKDWNEGRIEILVMHPDSAGHGLNLQHGGNVIVFFTPWWALEQHQQAIERIGPTRQAQSGYERGVFVYRIVADETVDEDVYLRLDGKANVQQALMDGMRARQGR